MNYLKEVEGIVGDNLFSRVYTKYRLEMETFPAAVKHHHTERGGYIRHVWEVLNYCDSLNFIQNEHAVSMEALIKIAFLHDLDKLERYELDPESPTKAQVKYAIDLGIQVTSEDSKSTMSTKIDNKKNGLDKPIQYYRHRGIMVIDESAKVCQMCSQLGIELSDEDIHCLATHHGGWSAVARHSSATGKRDAMSPMATILHCADLMSAKILG